MNTTTSTISSFSNGSDSRHARGRSGIRAARPTVLRRQGFKSVCCVWPKKRSARLTSRCRFLNVDTGHHFPELNEFRDRRAGELGAKLIVRKVEDAISKGIAIPSPGEISRNRLPDSHAAGGHRGVPLRLLHRRCARRDEEKARAKERFFSFRDGFGQWGPEKSAPGNLELYNARVNPG